jgi:hypothetical protein
MDARHLGYGVARGERRRWRELLRRRGQNVNHDHQARALWGRCRALSLAYLDAVIAVHGSGLDGATPDWGRWRNLNPDEQEARRDVDPAAWERLMEDTPWFPGRTLDHPRLEALEGEILGAWERYTAAAQAAEERPNCAGFDVERALLYRAGARAVGFDDQGDELAALEGGGRDLSGKRVTVILPPLAERVLGAGWAGKNALPEIELENRLVPDWEFPGYWLLKDNRAVSAPELAELLVDRPRVSALQRRVLRGEAPLSALDSGGGPEAG